jgi:lactoylglutathione lyase
MVSRDTQTPIGLDHAGVHVTDLERSITFYTAVFGLSVCERLSLGDEQLAFLEVGSAWLELMADNGDSRLTGVVDHFAFEVDELDAWPDRLRQYGVRLLDEAPLDVPALGARILFCLGPDDERIELIERHGTQARAV